MILTMTPIIVTGKFMSLPYIGQSAFNAGIYLTTKYSAIWGLSLQQGLSIGLIKLIWFLPIILLVMLGFIISIYTRVYMIPL